MYRVLKSLKVHCSDIPEGGASVAFQSSDAPWDGLKGFSVEDGPRGRLSVRRRGRDVFVQGEIRATFWFECSRCLERFRQTLEIAVSQMLRPSDAVRSSAREIELNADDLEAATYDGEDILLENIVEEHLLLSVPMQPLCDEGCKGLCPGCGANLNGGPCGCPGGERKSPFDCLKEFVVKDI